MLKERKRPGPAHDQDRSRRHHSLHLRHRKSGCTESRSDGRRECPVRKKARRRRSPAMPCASAPMTAWRGAYVTHWVGTQASLGQSLMLAPHLIGRDPEEREVIYDDLKRELRAYDHMGHGPIDIALWDLAGKKYGAPVARLLGGYPLASAGLRQHLSRPGGSRRARYASRVRRFRRLLSGAWLCRLQDSRVAER